MKRATLIFLGGALAAMTLSSIATAQRKSSSSRESGFTAYSLITERNIFDPNRTPKRRVTTTKPEATPTPTPIPVDKAKTIDLVGVWITERQRLAFVQGSLSKYSGTPEEGEEIAGWTVDSIILGRVLLKRQKEDGETETIEWPVGQRLREVSDGEWTLSGETPRDALGSGSMSGSSSSSSSSSASSSSSTGASGASTADILKRMRERRQRESQ